MADQMKEWEEDERRFAEQSVSDQAFVIREGDQEVWKAIVDGKVIGASFNSKGAAQAGIEVERRRQERTKR